MNREANILKGCISPVVTPFRADGSLDLPALSRVITLALGHGMDGIVLTALTGEGNLLSVDEQCAVWEAALSTVAGKRPTIVTILTPSMCSTIELAKAAERLGADAIMAVPILPELYAARADEPVKAYYQDLSNSTSLPVIAFNYPALSGIDLRPDLIADLQEKALIVAVKESTGDVRRVQHIKRLCGEDFQVICGAPNTALESLALGCDAWITGIMNVVPRSCRRLFEIIRVHRDLDGAWTIYDAEVLRAFDLTSRHANTIGTIKAGLAAYGIDAGAPRRPGLPLSTVDAEYVKRVIGEIAQNEEAA